MTNQKPIAPVLNSEQVESIAMRVGSRHGVEWKIVGPLIRDLVIAGYAAAQVSGSEPHPQGQSEPKGVPVAWYTNMSNSYAHVAWGKRPDTNMEWRPLYAAPPATPDKVSGEAREVGWVCADGTPALIGRKPLEPGTKLYVAHSVQSAIGEYDKAAAFRAEKECAMCRLPRPCPCDYGAAPPAPAVEREKYKETCPRCHVVFYIRQGAQWSHVCHDGKTVTLPRSTLYDDTAASTAGPPAAGEGTFAEQAMATLDGLNKAAKLLGLHHDPTPTPDDGRSQSDAELIARLENTPNWQRQDYGTWKDGCSVYDRAPFEAAARLRELLDRVKELERNAPYRKQYEEIIFQVQTKWPHETRHQTALRYVMERESAKATNAPAKTGSGPAC